MLIFPSVPSRPDPVALAPHTLPTGHNLAQNPTPSIHYLDQPSLRPNRKPSFLLQAATTTFRSGIPNPHRPPLLIKCGTPHPLPQWPRSHPTYGNPDHSFHPYTIQHVAPNPVPLTPPPTFINQRFLSVSLSHYLRASATTLSQIRQPSHNPSFKNHDLQLLLLNALPPSSTFFRFKMLNNSQNRQ